MRMFCHLPNDLRSLKSSGAVLLLLIGLASIPRPVGAADNAAANKEKPKPSKRSSVLHESILSVGDSPASEPDARQLDKIFEATTTAVAAAQDEKAKAQRRGQAAKDELNALENFIASHPDSSWTPSLRVNLGKHYRKEGRQTLALNHWEAAWQATKHSKDGDGKAVADSTLAHWTRLLASLGRLEKLKEIFQETQGRVLDRGPLSQVYLRTYEAFVEMQRVPEVSYRCGTYALAQVAFQLHGRNYDAKALDREGSPAAGFTLKALSEIADRLKLGVTGVHRPAGDELVVPSVVHWKQNHYAAITAKIGDLYQVVDPTFGHPTHLSAEAINAEASGYFMVPAGQALTGWRAVPDTEARQVVGRGNPNFMGDSDDQRCSVAAGNGGCDGCQASSKPGGMPGWRVSEPYINLWLEDVPLAYEPAYGPVVALELAYKQRDEYAGLTADQTSFGKGWNCNWLAYLENFGYSAVLQLPGGGKSTFLFNGGNEAIAPNYYNYSRLKKTVNPSTGYVTSFELSFPDGSKDIYGFLKADHEVFPFSKARPARPRHLFRIRHLRSRGAGRAAEIHRRCQ